MFHEENGADEKQNRRAEIGRKVRAARSRLDMTLAELAEATGFSVSYISQLERGVTAPSIASLKKIADALGVQAYSLMFEEEATGPDSNEDGPPSVVAQPPAVLTVRSDRRKSVILPGSDIQYNLLVPDLKRKTAVVTFRAPPGVNSGDEPFVHEGEEVGYVIRGVLEVEVAGVIYALNAGDSIFINSTTPHRWRNPGPDEAELVWVMTPPSF